MPPKGRRNKGKNQQGGPQEFTQQPGTQRGPQGFAPQTGQSRGAQGHSQQPGTQRDPQEFTQQHGIQGGPQEFPVQTGQSRGAQGYAQQPVTQRGPQGYAQQPVTQKGPQEFTAQTGQPRGAHGYAQQPGTQWGPQEFPVQTGQSRGPQGYAQQPVTQRGPQEFAAQTGQPRGAQGYSQQPRPQSSAWEHKQELEPQPGTQRGPQGFSHQTGQPRGGPGYAQQSGTQRGPQEFTQQSGTQRGPQGFAPQTGQPKGAEVYTQHSVSPRDTQPSTTQSHTQRVAGPIPPTVWKKSSQQIQEEDTRSSIIQPVKQLDLPLETSKDITAHSQKAGQGDIEQIQTQLSTTSINVTESTIKQPDDNTQKTSDDVISSTSSSKASDTRISPKRSQYIKMDLKINPTLWQKFLPKRPDEGGKKGRDIKLIINCLNMKIKPMKVYMYDIDLMKAEVTTKEKKKRDVKVKMQKKEMLRGIVYEFLADKGGVPVFDGGKIIFTNKMLPIDNNIVNKIEFRCTRDEEVVTCSFNLQRVKEDFIDLSEVTNYVESGTGRSDNLPQEALRALDSIMKEMFINKNLISIDRRAVFDPRTEKPLRCGPYILLDGYSATVRPHMWNIRFNFDKTQIVIHKAMNLYDYIGELTGNFRSFIPDKIKKKIHLLRVESTHLKNAEGKSYTRKYTIHGFSKFDATKERIDEKNMSIQQYFLQEYNIKLKYPQLVLIKTNPNKKTYIPMELLKVLPYQKVLANDPQIVQEVIRHSAIPAFDRLDHLKKAIKTLKIGDRADKFIKNYMIEIDENLINISGRVLDGPEGVFGGRTEFLRGGKWDFRNKRFFQPHPNKVNWALFAVGTERDYARNEKLLYDIEEVLPDAANRVGVKMEPMYAFQYMTWQRIEIVVPNIIRESEKDNKRLDLLVFVINYDDDYKAVKRFGDMTFGIATQCMKCATLQRQKGMDQYLANIMLKINTKLGGINWELSAFIKNIFTPIKGRFMVFGIDVTHPGSTRNDLSKSIAAMVGSLDHTASLYSAVIRQQISKRDQAIVEIVLDTEEMVKKLLLNFFRANKTLKPDHLIFYRDGVSEGQFREVFVNEIVAIQNTCEKLQSDYNPKITYIVVQKRHKIRFFAASQKDAVGKSGNVPAGTIVDKDITHCREFDFYLCSHEGIQGTSKPAHYHVLFDDNNWGSDDLQSFTFFLCHVYARSTRSVSYPAPTYYAHLAAFRGRALIGETVDDSSSSASEQTSRTPVDNGDSAIVIHDYHENKLFFI